MPAASLAADQSREPRCDSRAPAGAGTAWGRLDATAACSHAQPGGRTGVGVLGPTEGLGGKAAVSSARSHPTTKVPSFSVRMHRVCLAHEWRQPFPKYLLNNPREEMSGVQDIACWWVGVCKLTHTRTSLYVFKQQ